MEWPNKQPDMGNNVGMRGEKNLCFPKVRPKLQKVVCGCPTHVLCWAFGQCAMEPWE